MKYSLLLIAMLFMHIVDDFYLQGILAKMKQKSWWQENASDEEYKYDYIPALVAHAFSWAFMITLPILIQTHWRPHWSIILMLGINVVIHAIVDDAKANKHRINLIADQSIHITQVWATWLVHWLISIL